MKIAFKRANIFKHTYPFHHNSDILYTIRASGKKPMYIVIIILLSLFVINIVCFITLTKYVYTVNSLSSPPRGLVVFQHFKGGLIRDWGGQN